MRALLLACLLAPSLAWGKGPTLFSAPIAAGGGGGDPETIWTAYPSGGAANDHPGGVVWGTQFSTDIDGQIKGIRYQALQSYNPDTPTVTVALYTLAGTQLATASATASATNAWAEIDFASPVSITASTAYVAAVQVTYSSPNFLYYYAGSLSFPITVGHITAADGRFHASDTMILPTSYVATTWTPYIDVAFTHP